ncbi:MAG: KAP family NTPase [Desulfarculaceae bacterium]|nr:KAP family NTPase [Desulfarculaceae bacterium]
MASTDSSVKSLLTKAEKNLVSFEEDHLGREPLASTLSQLARTVTQPFVLAIDSPWGTGKTTFLKMWQEMLQKDGCSVIYFNAWENDFVEDPLSAFFGEIEGLVEQIKKQGKGTKLIEKYLEDIKSHGKGLIKNAIPILLSIVTRGAIASSGIELDKLNLQNENFENLVKGVSEDIIVNYRKNKESVIYFKNSLEKFARQIRKQYGDKYPLIIFVDELDRCRPDFAIKLLERIKHIFDAPNVMFVLAMDMEALSSAVARIYGLKMKEEGYLLRFFDFKIELPPPDRFEYTSYLLTQFHLEEALSRWHDPTKNDFGKYIGMIVGELCGIHNVSLRQQNRMMTVLNMVLRAVDYKHGKVGQLDIESVMASAFMPVIFTFFKVIRPDIYCFIKAGKADAIKSAFPLEPGPVDRKRILPRTIGRACIEMFCARLTRENDFYSWATNYFKQQQNSDDQYKEVKRHWEANFAGMLLHYPQIYENKLFEIIELMWR